MWVKVRIRTPGCGKVKLTTGGVVVIIGVDKGRIRGG